MPIDVEPYLSALGWDRFDRDGESVTVWFGDKGESRHHVVRLRPMADGIHLEATVVTARVLTTLESNGVDPHVWAWTRNRVSNLVGFRVDRQRRMVAEAIAPDVALRQEEFERYLTAVAAEADRMELVLTGQDVQ